MEEWKDCLKSSRRAEQSRRHVIDHVDLEHQVASEVTVMTWGLPKIGYLIGVVNIRRSFQLGVYIRVP